MSDSVWTTRTTRTKPPRSRDNSTQKGPRAAKQAKPAPTVGAADTGSGGKRERADKEAARDLEACLCVCCGGQFPIDALSQTAAARLVKHYRNEIHKREDKVAQAYVALGWERHRLLKALRKLWPYIVRSATTPAKRPALERELRKFEAIFLIDEGVDL